MDWTEHGVDKNGKPRVQVVCPDCGATRLRLRSHIRQQVARGTYTGQCLSCAQTGEANSCWRGGRRVGSAGYVEVVVKPEHPLAAMARLCGRTLVVMEHRLVMAEAIGRLLQSDEDVHHRNGVQADNRIENLVLMDHQQHRQAHRWQLPALQGV